MEPRRSSDSLRLVQLSDCHLPGDPRTGYRGRDADAGLVGLLPTVQRWNPDLLLLTGDLSEDASPAAYARLAAALQPLARPLLALPGNHDEPAALRSRFPRGPWRHPLAVDAGSWRVALLDSTVAGRVEGRLRAADIDWLERWLRENPAAPVLLALHHQPVPVGSPWIDQYMLQEPEALLRLVERQPMVRAVVWGHVHQDFAARCGAAMLLACPSTAVNSLPSVPSFTEDPAGPACRWLELHAGGSVRTGLLR